MIAAHELEKRNILFPQIFGRCAAANLSCRETPQSNTSPHLELIFPSGPEKRTIRIDDLWQAEDLLAFPFERCTFLTGYEGLCSYEDGYIEACLHELNEPLTSVFKDQKDVIVLGPSQEYPTLKIHLCGNAPRMRAFLRRHPAHPAIYIEGLTFRTHDEAIALLEKLTNSVLFDIDMRTGVALGLTTRRGRISRPLSPPDDLQSLRLPRVQYAREALSLYWHGRRAVGFPLLQFLAYYQSIEYYFIFFSQQEIVKKLRHLFKRPGFDPNRDSDMAQLLSTAHRSRSGTNDERSYLRATIQECIDPEGLRKFFTDEPTRQQFFKSNYRIISEVKVQPDRDDPELLGQVCDRIYDIRCNIVHSKQGSKDQLELLIPSSPVVEQLVFDIELVQYVSRYVLIAASTPLMF
jgi:hypothetical protein